MKKLTRRKTDARLWAAFARGREQRDRKARGFARGPGRLVDDPEFRLQVLMSEIAAELERAMAAAGIEGYADLGQRLGTSRQNAHKMLKQIEAANFKMETLARLSLALDCDVEVKFRPRARRQARQTEQVVRQQPADRSRLPAPRTRVMGWVSAAPWRTSNLNEPSAEYAAAPAATGPCPVIDMERLAA